MNGILCAGKRKWMTSMILIYSHTQKLLIIILLKMLQWLEFTTKTIANVIMWRSRLSDDIDCVVLLVWIWFKGIRLLFESAFLCFTIENLSSPKHQNWLLQFETLCAVIQSNKYKTKLQMEKSFDIFWHMLSIISYQTFYISFCIQWIYEYFMCHTIQSKMINLSPRSAEKKTSWLQFIHHFVPFWALRPRPFQTIINVNDSEERKTENFHFCHKWTRIKYRAMNFKRLNPLCNKH